MEHIGKAFFCFSFGFAFFSGSSLLPALYCLCIVFGSHTLFGLKSANHGAPWAPCDVLGSIDPLSGLVAIWGSHCMRPV